MKRLYDLIRSGSCRFVCSSSDMEWVFSMLTGAQQFEIENIARYYFSETEQEDWRPSRDLPNLAPPYPKMWFEYDVPDLIRNPNGVFDNSGHTTRHGVVIRSTDLRDERAPYGLDFPDGARWILTIGVFSRTVQGEVDSTAVSPAVVFLYIDPSGKTIVEAAPDGDMIQFGFSRRVNLTDEIRKSTWGAIVPALLSICFLHCKNVVVEDHQPPVGKRDRHGIHAKSPFKTLRVIPMRKVVHHEPGGTTGDKSNSRFHHKRGHFKTYTEEAPLFGRWTGTWWWSDQTVGDLSLGSIDKLYEVYAPKKGGLICQEEESESARAGIMMSG